MSVETTSGIGHGHHVVQFYERDDELTDTVGAFLAEALRAGEVAVFVATGPHADAIAAALAVRGVDPDDAAARGDLVRLDAAGTLAELERGGRPDVDAFDAVLGGLLRRLTRDGRHARVFGEMVSLLWDAGDVSGALELETMWNDLRAHVDFSLFCAYRARSVEGDDHADAFRAVCRAHSEVVGPSGSASGADLGAVLDDARTFACDSRAPGEARRFVMATLERWGRGDLVHDAAVVVTELATNAVVHARSELVVALSLRGGELRLSVRDGSHAAPAPREATSLESSGRGIPLVAAMASRWGTELVGDGKVVWAELRP